MCGILIICISVLELYGLSRTSLCFKAFVRPVHRKAALNPVRAGMVESPSEYKWSSFNSNGLTQPSKLWTPHQVYCALGNTMDKCALSYREIFKGQIGMVLLGEICQSVNKGLAPGNEIFKQEIERLSGRRVTSLKRGLNQNQKQ